MQTLSELTHCMCRALTTLKTERELKWDLKKEDDRRNTAAAFSPDRKEKKSELTAADCFDGNTEVLRSLWSQSLCRLLGGLQDVGTS